MTVPRKDLDTLNRSRKSALEKESKASADKAAAEKRKNQQDVDARASALIAVRKKSLKFSVDWSAAGHTALQTYKDVEAWAASFKPENAAVFSAPALIESCDLKLDTLQTVLDHWKDKYREHCRNTKNNSAQHELTKAQGVSELDQFWDKILPSSYMHTSSIPSVKTMCGTQYLYGYSETYYQNDFEPNFMGTVRYQVRGTTALLMASPGDLASGLPKLMQGVSAPVPLNKMRDWMLGLDDSNIALGMVVKAAGIKLVFGRITEQQILITPPGWLIGCISLGETGPYGIRRSFLPKGEAALHALTEILKCSTGQGQSETTTRLLTLIVDDYAVEKAPK